MEAPNGAHTASQEIRQLQTLVRYVDRFVREVEMDLDLSSVVHFFWTPCTFPHQGHQDVRASSDKIP